jgi:hypothetical protein
VEFNNLFDLLGRENATKATINSTEQVVAIEKEASEEENEESGKESLATVNSTKPKKAKSGKRKGKARKPPKAQKAITKKSSEEKMLDILAKEMAQLDAEDEEDELYFST